MLVSGMFDSKFFNNSKTNQYYQHFTLICEQLHQLDDQRIVQKLARPTHIDVKVAVMNEANQVLESIRILLQQIKQLSIGFKSCQLVTIGDRVISSHAWKNGIRKVQARITDFYENKMKYFQAVNTQMKLGLCLVELDQKQWAKSCISKMSSFCICG